MNRRLLTIWALLVLAFVGELGIEACEERRSPHAALSPDAMAIPPEVHGSFGDWQRPVDYPDPGARMHEEPDGP